MMLKQVAGSIYKLPTVILFNLYTLLVGGREILQTDFCVYTK